MTTADYDADQLRHRLDILLGDIPSIATDAETTFARQSKTGGDAGKIHGGGETPLPYHAAIGETLRDLKNVLTSWALMVADEAGHEITCHDTTRSVAAWLMHHTRWLSRHPAGGEMEDEIKELTDTLRRLTDLKIDKRQFVGWHGDTPLYAKPDQDTLALPDGTTVDVQAKREEMLASLRWRAFPPEQCAEIASRYFGVTMTAKNIRRWIDYDTTHEIRHDPLAYVPGKRVVIVWDAIKRCAAAQANRKRKHAA